MMYISSTHNNIRGWLVRVINTIDRGHALGISMVYMNVI